MREEGSPPERLLQAVWQHQRVLRDQLTLADGRTVRVLHPGFLNREAGPDFRDALVQFGSDTPLRGDVEVDLAASGWHAHRHDVNPNFRAVVLHVVWDGRDTDGLPTLALKSRLDAPLGELSEWFGGEDATRSGGLAGKCCGPLHELPRGEGSIGECYVPMGNHHGHRCLCGIWVWGGPTVCRRCVNAEAVKITKEWKDEAERLRLRADTDAKAKAEWNRLHDARHRLWREEADRVGAVKLLLEANGCDCDCDHDAESHDSDCERCLACRISLAIGT